MSDDFGRFDSQDISASHLLSFARERRLQSARDLVEQFVLLVCQDEVLLDIGETFGQWNIGSKNVGGATIKLDEDNGQILMRPWNHQGLHDFEEVQLYFDVAQGKLEGTEPDPSLPTRPDEPFRRKPAIAVLAEAFVRMATISKGSLN